MTSILAVSARLLHVFGNGVSSLYNLCQALHSFKRSQKFQFRILWTLTKSGILSDMPYMSECQKTSTTIVVYAAAILA
jgi:hypothetical protein